MPPSVRELATTAALHDGQIQGWELVQGVLNTEMIVGDTQAGYSCLALTYTSAEVTPGGLLESELTGDVEVLYDEITLTPNGRWEHRLLLWPYREVTIAFAEVRLRGTTASAGDRR